MDLTEKTLEELIKDIRACKDDKGERLTIEPTHLFIDPACLYFPWWKRILIRLFGKKVSSINDFGIDGYIYRDKAYILAYKEGMVTDWYE